MRVPEATTQRLCVLSVHWPMMADAAAQFNLGVMYLAGPRRAAGLFSRSIMVSEKLRNKGYALAQTNLGVLYRDGRGVAEDVTEAVMWFQKAADQGDAVAEFQLGKPIRIRKKAYRRTIVRQWPGFRKASEQGHRKATLFLGVMYAEGRGVSAGLCPCPHVV